jgi:DNA polymerase III subunit epsilon
MDKLFFDIESTGLSTETDRIVQLAIMVVSEDGTILVDKSKLYNPTIPISKTAFEAHGICDNDVKNAPLFSSDAKKLKKLFENKIIIGYNIMRFDVPLLLAEFSRAKVDVDFSGKFLDVLNIEKKLNSNRLADAYFRYTGKELSGAHDAGNDVRATKIIFEGQEGKLYETIGNQITDEVKSLPEMVEDQLYDLSGTNNMVDIYNKLKRDKEGYLIFNFGKHNGKRVIDESQYAGWILDNEFPIQVKNLIREEQTRSKLGKEPKRVGLSDTEAKELIFGLPKVKFGGKDKGWVPLHDDLPF